MKIKIGVFFGGRSVEHEVSIISAIQAINNMNKEKYDIIPIYITKSNEMYVGEKIGKIEEYRDLKKLIEESQRVILVPNGERVDIIKYPFKKFGKNEYDYIDLAFPIVHGTNVEDGTLQGYLKTLGIPFVGPDVLGSAIGMDKYVMKTVLKDNGIPVLDCLRFDMSIYTTDCKKILEDVEAKISYPVIVKPINLGSSVGIKVARNREELQEAVDYAFQYAMNILIEKAITNLKEINCSVIGDYETAESSECEEPVNTDEILSYEDKYIGGNKDGGSKGMASLQRKIPADISEEERKTIRELAAKTFQTLGCSGLSRIDFIMDYETRQIWVNEINTIPGSLSFYLWEPLGVKYPDLLDKMIDIALKREREEKSITYDFETKILEGINLNGVKGSKGSKF